MHVHGHSKSRRVIREPDHFLNKKKNLYFVRTCGQVRTSDSEFIWMYDIDTRPAVFIESERVAECACVSVFPGVFDWTSLDDGESFLLRRKLTRGNVSRFSN